MPLRKDSIETKKKILAVCVRLFLEQGYRETTISQIVEEAGVAHMELGGVRPNPRSDLVYEGIRLCKENGVDFVLPVGGGSAIDTAKAIADGACYDGDFWDFYCGRAKVTRALPHGCVLTIPAAGSEGSTSSVITQLDGNLKRGLNTEFHRPRFAVMNPELVYTLPRYQLACGITDMMAHIMERYFTNTPDVALTDRLAEALLCSIIEAAPVAMARRAVSSRESCRCRA